MPTATTVEQGESRAEHAPEKDARFLLMQRVLASPDFVRSPQLSKFLLYICRATFAGQGHTLNEQHVGVAVFGREPDYDSAADTIVRSHALRLRRKLEQYFHRAGRDEALRIVIPRGGYVPVFVAAEELHSYEGGLEGAAEPVREEVVANASLGVEERRGGWRRYWVVTGLALLLCLGVSIAFAVHLRGHVGVVRHLLWGRIFSEDQPTQIVLGDSGLVLFHAVTRQYVSLHDYLSGDFSKQMPFVEKVTPEFAQFLLHRRYTSMVDASATARLLRLPEASPERTLVHYSRDMHLNDFKTENLILIGAQEANPWVELFESQMDLAFSIDNPDKHSSFLNRRPGAGERVEYNSVTPETRSKAYAVVAFLPNLSGTGNVLLLEGLSVVGTEAAVDLVTDDDRLLPILRKIRRSDGTLPHFEILLEADTLGESAGPARVVIVHLHP